MNSENTTLRLLILGAHPDDAEFHAGGLATRYRAAGHEVRMISVTDGSAGHHRLKPPQLVDIRREEARAAGAVIGAEYLVWDFADGHLQPSLELREAIIREIRTYQPDLVLTHRTNDYHPDHRAVGQAVQDASYMVTVPLIAADVPALRKDPVVAYMPDLFTRPNPLRPDIVLDTGDEIESTVAMLACHASQVFDFLPFNGNYEIPVPADADERLKWLRDWYIHHTGSRASFFRQALCKEYGSERGEQIEFAEAFEISEYAAGATLQQRRQLFLLENP